MTTSYWFKNKESQQAANAIRYANTDYRVKMLNAAKARAKSKGLEFTLTKADIKLNKKCPLLGIKIDYSSDKAITHGRKGRQKNSPSLDRIDSSKGYTPDNVWVISSRANTIKNDATLEELKLITKNLGKAIG